MALKPNNMIGKSLQSTKKATPKKETTVEQKMNKAKTNLTLTKKAYDASKEYSDIGKKLYKPTSEKYAALSNLQKSGKKSDAREIKIESTRKSAGLYARLQKSNSQLNSQAKSVGEASRTSARAKAQFKKSK